LMKKHSLLFLLPLFILLLPPGARGQSRQSSAPVDITARDLSYDRAQNVYTAEGDVEVVQGTTRLNADHVLLNDTTKDAFAEGHVIFQDQGDTVHAEKMTYNLETNKGTIENGKIFIKKGDFYLTGDEIQKTGESTYVVRRGEFTTCGWDKPAWTFAAENVDLTVGGYATTKHTTFSIMGQKVFYLPWGIFPVNTQRQSGFLLPEFQLSSRDGTILRDAYFWAISKDTDATFFGDWIQDRGVKPGVEYRYALSEHTKGVWYGSIIDDMKYGHTRYEIRGKHEQLFGDMALKADIDHVSDFDYMKDFGRTFAETSENSLRSVAFIEKPLPRSLLTAGATHFDDLSQKNQDNVFNYLPFASFSTEYIPILGNKLYTDLTTGFTNFTRDTGDKFTRLAAQPSVRLPYSLNGLNFLFSGSIIENSYLMDRNSVGGKDTVHHEAVKGEGDVNIQLLKNGRTDLFGLGDVESIIMPRVQYTYMKNTTSFADIPSIDPSDRADDTNTLTYSLSHYFNAVTDGQAREISLLEIAQTYGLSGNLGAQPYLYEGSGHRLSDLRVRFTLFPNSTFWYVNEDVFNIYGQGLRISRNSVHYALPPIVQADVSHSYSKDPITKNNVNELLLNTMGKWKSFDLHYQIRYSFISDSWIDSLASVTYHPSCWGVTLTLVRTRRPEDTSVHVTFSLQGITQKLGGF
jgi:LPS-assembly protein